MSKEIYISSTPHETRLAIVEDEQLAEIYYERENEYTLAGSIYKGRVTRVLPGMQSSFVDVGLERDAFLYVTDFMEEQGESADFESASQAGGRRERGQERGPDRNQENGSAEPVAERTADRQGSRDGSRGRSRNRQGQGDRNQAPRPEPVVAAPVPSEVVADAGDAGEGAPGADGSRRWRGRRGRRRGRGGLAERGEARTQTGENQPGEAQGVDSAAEDFTGDAVTSAEQHFTSPVADYDEPIAIDGSAEQIPARGRRQAGRDAGRDDRRDARHQTGRNAESAERNAEPAFTAAPMIMPGESLSRYRRGDEPASGSSSAAPVATSSFANTIVAKPSTMVEAPLAWDGGLQLPGESLSRHRGATQAAPTPIAPQATAPAATGVEKVEEAAAAEAHMPEHHEDVAAATKVEKTAPVVAIAEPATAEPATHTDEYEPKEAAASYRLDPAAPSEYRQSVVEAEPEEQAVAPHVAETHAAEPVHAEHPAAEPATAHHHVSERLAPMHGDDAMDVTSTSTVPTLHAVDAEPVHEVPVTHHNFEMEAASAQPVQHAQQAAFETEEQEEEAPEELHHASGIQQEATAHTLELPAAGYTPLAGLLEEEIIDEEEYDFEPIHAHADEDGMDDLEEETLEGAADLGSMVRDMHLEERTRSTEPDSLDDDFGDTLLEDDEEEFGEPLDEEEGEGADDTLPDAISTAPNGDVATAPAPERRGGRDGRRGSRDGRRGGSRDGRRSGPGGGGRGRQSMQMSALPIISELLKPGQEILVQIAKEPIAKKGARITSHIALPGRFLVFMPTVNHTGVSRKIESDGERRRLKEILLSEKGEASGGFIVRTAAAGATEEELRSDLRFLLNLWADIKQRSESSKSPALIYHDLNLVERILRDQVTDNFSAIWVDTETDYERILRFLQRFQPALIRRVKLYTKETPLFEQFGITEEINKALRSKVWLKSGGSIVINQTEALVAIDINTGKFVGKTARLEDTIVKTNLDAIPEIVRQIRLRDLGGIIIIDFIDMDERKNRNKVMAALEEELKSDRAPSKVLQFNDFGLVAITRKRVKQSLERTLSTTCNVCVGTGMVKSPITVCNDIYIEMRKMHKHLDRGDVMLRVNPEVVKQLKSTGSKWLQEMEEMVGRTILVKSDPSLHPEQFDIH